MVVVCVNYVINNVCVLANPILDIGVVILLYPRCCVAQTSASRYLLWHTLAILLEALLQLYFLVSASDVSLALGILHIVVVP